MNHTLKKVLGALLLTLVISAALVATVLAVTKTPPYVVAVQDTGTDSHPDKVAVDPVRGLAYVLDELGKLWIFDGTSITRTLNLNASDIGVDPGGYTYLTSDEGNPVRILQGTTLVGEVDVGIPTGKVAVLTTTHDAYVTTSVTKVLVLNGTGPVVTVTLGMTPTAIAANPATDYVYVAHKDYDRVSVIDGTTVITTIPVGDSPSHIAVNPENGYIYVSNAGRDAGGNTVTVLQGTTVVTTIAVGVSPGDIAINTTTGLAYVVNNGSPITPTDPGSMTVITPTSWEKKTIDVGDDPRAVDVNSNSGYIYVIGGQDVVGTVSVLSQTLVVETFLPVGHSPRDIAVDPRSDLGYASLYKTGDVGRVIILGRTTASSIVVDPSSPSVTPFDCQGLGSRPIDILLPSNAVTETVTLLCWPWEADTDPNYAFAGQGFFLKAYRYGMHRPGLRFQAPITVGVGYSDLSGDDLDEEDLALITGSPTSDWIDDSPDIHLLAHSLQENTITYTLDALPVLSQDGYALVVPRSLIYLPLVLRN